MKKVIKSLLVLAIMTVFVACSSSTPKSAMEKYGTDLCKGNYQAYVEGIATDEPLSANEKAQFIALVKDKAQSEYDKKGGLKDIKVIKEDIAAGDSTAVVYYEVHFGNGTAEDGQQKMVLQDGKWKMDIGSK